MQEKGQPEKNRIKIGIIAGFSVFLIAIASWIKNPLETYIIRNVCVYSLMLALTLYKFYLDREKRTLNYNNCDNPQYFLYSLMASFVIALFCSFVSPLIWPLLPTAIALSLFSNALCGLVGYIYIISIPIMIANTDNWIFSLYLLVGLIVIIGFDGWERNFNSVKPFLIISFSLLVLQTVSICLFSDFENIVFFILPSVLNVFINTFFIFVFLKRFTVTLLKNDEDQYMDINDQSYVLMEKLKEDSIDDYYRCIHTAHFSDILSSNVSADNSAVRSAAYYYRFGLIYSKLGVAGNNMSEYMLLMMDAHHFPQKARSVIEELCNKKLVSKESALVYLADYFIKSISFLMKEKPDDKPDWDKCVDYVFDRSLDENVFEQCAITVGELKTCMTLLKRDKMYYEFLCRK